MRLNGLPEHGGMLSRLEPERHFPELTVVMLVFKTAVINRKSFNQIFEGPGCHHKSKLFKISFFDIRAGRGRALTRLRQEISNFDCLVLIQARKIAINFSIF